MKMSKHAFNLRNFRILAVVAAASVAQAVVVSQSSFSGGSVTASSSNFVVHGTVGQSVVGASQSDSFASTSGFWQLYATQYPPPDLQPQTFPGIEDNTTVIDLVITAPAGNVSYTLTSLPQNGTVSISGEEVAYNPAQNFFGTDSFQITASTGIFGAGPVTVTMNVDSRNDKPFLTTIGDQSVNEGELLQITLTATDIDNTTLTYSVDLLPDGATLQGAVFDWTPAANQAGQYTLTFEVTDGEDQTRKRSTITVADVFQALFQADGLDFFDVPFGQPHTLELIISNPGNTSLQITSVSSDNGQFSVDPTTFEVPAGSELVVQVTFEPTEDGPQSGTLTFVGNGESAGVVSVTGTGISAILLVLETPSPPVDVVVGDSVPLQVVIENAGAGVLQVTSVEGIGGSFEIGSTVLPLSIAARESGILELAFQPQEAGDLSRLYR